MIKKLQEWLAGFEHAGLLPLTEVLTDVTDGAGTYALQPAGNATTSIDILGNRIYTNNFVFYAKEYVHDEASRRENYDFLESLQEWIEEQEVLPSWGRYSVEQVEVSNGLLFDIGDDGSGIYQVQIQVTIRKEKKDG